MSWSINIRYTIRRGKKIRLLSQFNFGWRHVDTCYFARRNRLPFSLPFTFSDVAKEQAIPPRGVTRVFFFHSEADASFKRFMPGIARPSRDNVRDVRNSAKLRHTYLCICAMFNSNCIEGSREGGYYSLWLKFCITLASTLLPGDGDTTLIIFNRVFLSTHLCLRII